MMTETTQIDDARPVKERRDPVRCVQCGRVNWSRQSLCVYCRLGWQDPQSIALDRPLEQKMPRKGAAVAAAPPPPDDPPQPSRLRNSFSWFASFIASVFSDADDFGPREPWTGEEGEVYEGKVFDVERELRR